MLHATCSSWDLSSSPLSSCMMAPLSCPQRAFATWASFSTLKWRWQSMLTPLHVTAFISCVSCVSSDALCHLIPLSCSFMPSSPAGWITAIRCSWVQQPLSRVSCKQFWMPLPATLVDFVASTISRRGLRMNFTGCQLNIALDISLHCSCISVCTGLVLHTSLSTARQSLRQPCIISCVLWLMVTYSSLEQELTMALEASCHVVLRCGIHSLHLFVTSY